MPKTIVVEVFERYDGKLTIEEADKSVADLDLLEWFRWLLENGHQTIGSDWYVSLEKVKR